MSFISASALKFLYTKSPLLFLISKATRKAKLFTASLYAVKSRLLSSKYFLTVTVVPVDLLTKRRMFNETSKYSKAKGIPLRIRENILRVRYFESLRLIVYGTFAMSFSICADTSNGLYLSSNTLRAFGFNVGSTILPSASKTASSLTSLNTSLTCCLSLSCV